MPLLDDIEIDPPQPPSCGALSHADYCAMSDALERAEFVERVPALQQQQFYNITHPLLARFRRAALDRQYARAPETVTIDPDATCGAYRLVQEQRETGGVRRAAELEARLYKAHRDFLLTRALMPPRQQYCIIDGQTFPVSQTPKKPTKRKSKP
jgi:hypothetical protein